MEELEKETCKIIAALRQTIFDLESPNQRASFGPQTGSEGAHIASYLQLSYGLTHKQIGPLKSVLHSK